MATETLFIPLLLLASCAWAGGLYFAVIVRRDVENAERQLNRIVIARNEIRFYQKYLQRLEKAQGYARMAMDNETATTRAVHQGVVEAGLGYMSKSKRLKPYVPVVKQTHDTLADTGYAIWSAVKSVRKKPRK